MAKGSQFWGHASGKLGEQVLYRAGGEQRARSYTKNVKNPKTLAQMKNRITMANLVAVFNKLKPILRESFPNRPTNQSGFNAFVSANKNKQTPVLDPGMIALGYSVPYNMNISKGDIQLPEFTPDNMTIGIGYGVSINVVAADYAQLSQSQRWEKVLELWGMPADTKITAIVATDADEGFELQFATGSASNLQPLAALLGNDSMTVNIDAEGNPNVADVVLAKSDETKMYGFIFSYTGTDGKLHVSTSRIKKGAAAGPDVAPFLPGGEVYESVLAKYGYNEDSLLSTK